MRERLETIIAGLPEVATAFGDDLRGMADAGDVAGAVELASLIRRWSDEWVSVRPRPAVLIPPMRTGRPPASGSVWWLGVKSGRPDMGECSGSGLPGHATHWTTPGSTEWVKLGDDPMKFVLHFDGACEPNPGGVATYGFVITKGKGVLHSEGGMVASGPEVTNNVAEYTALGRGIRWFKDNRPKGDWSLSIYGDSQLVVNQVNGQWKCNKDHLVKLRDRCRELLAGLDVTYSLEWVPRTENAAADAESVKAWVVATGKQFPVRERAAS